MVLLAPLLFLLLILYVGDLRNARSRSRSTIGLLRSPIVRVTVGFAALLTLPWLIVHHSSFTSPWIGDERFLLFASLIVSFLISYTWYRYLTWLDSFEPERPQWELLVFLLSCSISLLVPRGYRILEEQFAFTLTGDHWNDWWYCVGVIGGLEEVAKLLPLLFIWRITRQVNEPFDFLLYASISALGFAFVENTGYLRAGELDPVMGRAVMSSVAHMFFSSIPAYGLAIAIHRNRSWLFPRLLLFLALAALGHGFYDFWLLGPDRPRILTVLFFILSLQLWVVMKNNLVNISPRYERPLWPDSGLFRYKLINGLLFVLAAAYLFVYLHRGTGAADELLAANASTMGLMLLLTALNFSSFAPIPGYIAPLRLPDNLFRLLLPRVNWEVDISGARVELRPPVRLPLLKRWAGPLADLPPGGSILRRVVVGDETDWYLMRPDLPMRRGTRTYDQLLLQVHPGHEALNEVNWMMVRMAGAAEGTDLSGSSWEKHELVLLAHPLARLVNGPEAMQAAP